MVEQDGKAANYQRKRKMGASDVETKLQVLR
jgi:hypothetical protein